MNPKIWDVKLYIEIIGGRVYSRLHQLHALTLKKTKQVK